MRLSLFDNHVTRTAIISGVFLLLIVMAFITRLNDLQNEVVLDKTTEQASRLTTVCTLEQLSKNKAKCEAEARTEKHHLFDKLMQHPTLITVKPDGTLKLPARDYLLALRAKGETKSVTPENRSLIERLYGTTAGKAVQQQVAWWNHSRRFAALRDNIKQDNDQSSNWVAKDEWEGTIAGRDAVPLDYGYVNAGKIPQGFNNWLSVTNSETVIFQREVDPKQQTTLNLQIIGQPDISRLAPHNVTLEACFTEKDERNRRKSHCETVDSAVPDADVYRLRVELAAGKPQQITLPVTPTNNQQLTMDGLSIHLKPKKQTDQLATHYQQEDYAWSPLYDHVGNTPRPSSREQFSYRLASSNGTTLFDSHDNQPTLFTQKQGLLSLIGYDNNDRLALAGMMARAPLNQDNTEVRLTLDDDIQKLAYQHLQDELKEIDPDGRYDDVRRAAVVMMKPDTGAILAAANYPNPPANVNRWDRLSFSKLYPTQDKFSVPAWQGLDNNNTPGSVFKLVTALTGLQAAEEGDTQVRQMIRGMKARDFTNLTGLPVTAYSYQADPEKTSKVHNASNVPLLAAMPHKDNNGKTVYPPLRSTKGEGCPTRPQRSNNLGLRETVRDSMNIWFSRLGVLMDEQNLLSGGKDTRLVKMADELGFGGKLPLAQEGSLLNPQGRLTDHRGRGTVLSAYTGNLTLKTNSTGLYAKGDALQRLSQNSFGQGVSTTPLQIARVAATVATGYLPQPYLLESWDGSRLDAPGRKALEPDDIELLRAGMKAVPEVGTAKNAFNKYYPQGKCRTYGKTGTAQVVGGKGKRSRYSAWFTGWLESADGSPEIVFACMVTHTYRENHNYGGDACAPIIARTLRDLEQKKQAEAGQ